MQPIFGIVQPSIPAKHQGHVTTSMLYRPPFEPVFQRLCTYVIAVSNEIVSELAKSPELCMLPVIYFSVPRALMVAISLASRVKSKRQVFLGATGIQALRQDNVPSRSIPVQQNLSWSHAVFVGDGVDGRVT